MSTRVKFTKNIKQIGNAIDGYGVDREYRYFFKRGDIIDLTNDDFAAELINDGHGIATTDATTAAEEARAELTFND